MVKRRQTRQRRWTALAMIGAFVLSAPILTGCSSTPTTAQQHHDPLHGVFVPPGAAPQPTNSPKASGNTLVPAPQTGSINGIPPIPNNNTSTNPATLASMSFAGPLGRPLAIDDEGKVQTGPLQPTGFVPPNANPKVEQVPDANPTWQSPAPAGSGSWQLPSANIPPALPANPTASVAPADALRQQLQARGVVNQKLDPTADGVRLTCYVPQRDSDGIRVLQANGSDYADAAQAILRQLDPRP